MYKNIAIVAALMAALMIGCGDKDDSESSNAGNSVASSTANDMTSTSVSVPYFCGKCGQSADKDHVCKADGEVCSCGLHKGSDMCCNVPDELKGKDICSCGYVKGSENCCKDGAARCDKCHMIKGSTMCCKIPHDHDGEGHVHDDDDDGNG